MQVELFNILKTGNQEKVLVRRQEFQDRRTLIAVDPHNEVFWIFYGTETDPEIIRVTKFALDDLHRKYGKLKQVVVENDEWSEKSQYLIGLFKNPELALAGGKLDIKETKAVKAKVLSGGAASGIPKVAITGDSGKKVLPKADIPEGKVETIHEFQITYYEGGRLVIDDLEEDLAEGSNRSALIAHISLINKLVKDGATVKEALDELEGSLEDMVKEIFPEKKVKKTTKAPKKTTKKAKKVEDDEVDDEVEEEKPAKKATKKAKKTTKKAEKTSKKSSKQSKDNEDGDDEVEEKPNKAKKSTKKAKKTTKKKSTKKSKK